MKIKMASFYHTTVFEFLACLGIAAIVNFVFYFIFKKFPVDLGWRLYIPAITTAAIYWLTSGIIHAIAENLEIRFNPEKYWKKMNENLKEMKELRDYFDVINELSPDSNNSTESYKSESEGSESWKNYKNFKKITHT